MIPTVLTRFAFALVHMHKSETAMTHHNKTFTLITEIEEGLVCPQNVTYVTF